MKALAVVLVTVLVLTGVAYAAWSRQLYINSTVTTGSLDWYWTAGGGQDTGTDWVTTDWTGVDPQTGYALPAPTPATGDYGSTAIVVRPGHHHYLEVTVNNGYPGYYNRIWANFTVDGSIPVKINPPLVSWDDINWIPLTRSQTYVSNNYLEVNWISWNPPNVPGVGDTLQSGQSGALYFEVHIRDGAVPQSAYHFYITLPGTQGT